jgi:hypothetical protein
MSILSIHGYHACGLEGGEAYVAAHAPFRSGHNSYLGVGYYLWEHYLEDGIRWGNVHYKKKGFYVVECTLTFDDSSYLDLLGSLRDRQWLSGMLDEMKNYGYDKPLALGAIIDFLRMLEDDLFPYNVVRCVLPDDSKIARPVRFIESAQAVLQLRQRVMVCFYSKQGVTLVRRKVVETRKPF